MRQWVPSEEVSVYAHYAYLRKLISVGSDKYFQCGECLKTFGSSGKLSSFGAKVRLNGQPLSPAPQGTQTTTIHWTTLTYEAHRTLSMYAIKPRSSIYHLVEKPTNITLCGLRVSQVPSMLALHLVKVLPINQSLCKHCDRLKTGEQAKE